MAELEIVHISLAPVSETQTPKILCLIDPWRI